MASNRRAYKPFSIKGWKFIDSLFHASRLVRENTSLAIWVDKESPIFEGKFGTFEGDPRASVRVACGKLNIHLSWAEAVALSELIQEARAACSRQAEEVEEEYERRRAEREKKRLERRVR